MTNRFKAFAKRCFEMMRLDCRTTTYATKRQACRFRRAMTLVEVMVVVSLSSVLLGVVITVAVGLQQWDSRFREHAVHGDQLARLAEAIRSDIRQATDVSLPGKDVLAIAAANGIKISYEIRPEGCQRMTKRFDAASQPGELFTIGPVSHWKVEREAGGRRPAVVISLEAPGADEFKTGPTQMLVYATLGADLPDATKVETSGEPAYGQKGAGL
jgi:prepilin-type N-terminal cleavage/methylation domain-containing protein